MKEMINDTLTRKSCMKTNEREKFREKREMEERERGRKNVKERERETVSE